MLQVGLGGGVVSKSDNSAGQMGSIFFDCPQPSASCGPSRVFAPPAACEQGSPGGLLSLISRLSHSRVSCISLALMGKNLSKTVTGDC